jgi:excisionase family DNA binding protein
MAEILLTAQEVAERLKVPVKTLHQWRKNGWGPQGKKLGVRVVFREKDVDAWIQDQFEKEEA